VVTPPLVQFPQGDFIREEATLPVSDRQTQERPVWATVGKTRIAHLDPRCHHFANEVERAIPNQGPGKQANFAKNLKPVADTDNQFPISRLLHHTRHDR
jgi:hypothetical protein